MLISNPLKLYIMKRSFLFFLAVAAFAVVTGCEEKIVSETPPEITLDATEITIPGAGGQCEFVYSIENPVADGKLTANSEDGWMTDFTVASDTMVTFVAEPNESGAPRNGLITLKYTYGADGEVTADVKVSQGVAGAAPEIELGAAPSIPAEGGDFELTYKIINPAADGKVSAASEADWLTLNADNPGVIAITAAANTGEERKAEINVVYEYGDGRIEAAAEVIQAAAGQASKYDYEYDMSCFDGIYYGQTYGNNGEYNYYTWISDIGFDADGYQMPGGTYYLFDIYVAAPPEDADNPLPPAGTYNLGSGPGMTEDMTFSYDYSNGVSIAEDGTSIFEAYFNEGTLTIRYEGSNIIMDAVLTDEKGMVHHVTYEGPVSYDNEGGDEPGPSTGSTLEQDLNIEAGTALASYVADDGYVMEVSLQFTDMEVDMEGYVVPPGSIMTVDMFMPFKDNGELNPGTYDVAATYEDYTVYPGELYYDILPMGTYVSYYPDANTEQLGFVVSGAMEISGSALGGYTVTCDFTTDNGYTIECSYSGNLEIQGIPGPYSTLEGDYTLDLEGASGGATYYGDYYYTGGANWIISLNPLSGPDGFMTEIVAESTSFEEGIPTGTYEAGASVTILYPGEYMTGFMDGDYLFGTNYVGGFTSDGYVTEFAPAISGDLNITNNNDGTYIISFSFVDDLGNTWEGEWEGEMQLEDGSGSYYAPRRSSVSILRNSSFNTVDKKEVMENLPVKAVKLQPDNRTVRKSVSAR